MFYLLIFLLVLIKAYLYLCIYFYLFITYSFPLNYFLLTLILNYCIYVNVMHIIVEIHTSLVSSIIFYNINNININSLVNNELCILK